MCARVKSDFILQIILLHNNFYRYDVHDTIFIKTYTFLFINGDAMEV